MLVYIYKHAYIFNYFTKKMLTIFLSVILFFNFGECMWKQNGTWISNSNGSKLLQNHLNVSKGLVHFKYYSMRKLVFLYFVDVQQNKNTVQISFQMRLIKITNQPQNYLDSPVNIRFYRKNVYNVNEVIQIKQDLSFNISYIYRRIIKLQFQQSQYTVYLKNIQRKSPNIYYILVVVVISVAILVYILSSKISLILKNIKKTNKILGLHSIEIILLWTAKSMIALWDQTYYFQYSQGMFFLQMFICLLQLGIVIQYMIIIHQLRIKDTKLRQDNLRSIIVVAIYWIGFLLEVFQIMDIHLWQILLIINIYEITQITKVPHAQNIVSNQQTIIFMLFYLIPIAIFPFFAQETNYPKEEAQLWYVYVILCILQVAIFFFSLNGGATIFKIQLLLLKKQMNPDKYQKIQQKTCPICVEEVEITEILMGSAGQLMDSKWIKNKCNHYFHRTCLKHNKNKINQCPFDGEEFSQQLKTICPKK